VDLKHGYRGEEGSSLFSVFELISICRKEKIGRMLTTEISRYFEVTIPLEDSFDASFIPIAAFCCWLLACWLLAAFTVLAVYYLVQYYCCLTIGQCCCACHR